MKTIQFYCVNNNFRFNNRARKQLCISRRIGRPSANFLKFELDIEEEIKYFPLPESFQTRCNFVAELYVYNLTFSYNHFFLRIWCLAICSFEDYNLNLFYSSTHTLENNCMLSFQMSYKWTEILYLTSASHASLNSY